MDIKKDFEKEYKKHKELANLKESKGGKLLIELMSAEVINLLYVLLNKYKEMSETELRATLAKMNALDTIIYTLNGSEKVAEFYKEELQKIYMGE